MWKYKRNNRCKMSAKVQYLSNNYWTFWGKRKGRWKLSKVVENWESFNNLLTLLCCISWLMFIASSMKTCFPTPDYARWRNMTKLNKGLPKIILCWEFQMAKKCCWSAMEKISTHLHIKPVNPTGRVSWRFGSNCPSAGFLDKGKRCLVKSGDTRHQAEAQESPFFSGRAAAHLLFFQRRQQSGGKQRKQLFCCFAFPRGLTGSVSAQGRGAEMGKLSFDAIGRWGGGGGHCRVCLLRWMEETKQVGTMWCLLPRYWGAWIAL